MLWRAPWLSQRLVLIGLATWDAATLYGAYNLTYLARIGYWEGWNEGLTVVMFTWLGTSYLLGRYSPERNKAKRLRNDMVNGFYVVCVVLAVFVGHSWIYQVIDAKTRFRGFLIPMMAMTWVISNAMHLLLTGAKGKEKCVVIGSSGEREILVSELENESEGLQKRTKIVSSDSFAESIDRIGWEEYEIAVGELGSRDGEIVDRLLRVKEMGVRIRPLLNWCESDLQRIPPELVHPEWLVQAEGFGLRPGSLNWRIKRFGDVIGALTLLLVTMPIVVLAGLLVWLEDRGPVIYSQIRTGMFGRRIRILKLRSMKQNSETSGPQWSCGSDPRVTRIGKLIRATRVDELPQLLNVLNGDLSLIGPRPERPEIETDLEKIIPNYRIRHWIRPGLSGWAQVCYPYGASIEDSRNKLAYDLYYIRNAGILLDVLITLKTMKLIVTAQGSTPNNDKEHIRKVTH